MRAEVGWVTATGAREANQDCVLVGGMLSAGEVASEAAFDVDAASPVLVAVFDGLGGHAGGGIASRVAAGVLGSAPAPETAEELVALVRRAHRSVASFAQSLPGTHGMGTTVVGFVLGASSYRVFHAGDSLAFRLVDGPLGRLTEPHVTADPRRPDATLITRCLGIGADDGPDVDEFPLRRQVRLLACSDGVSEVLSSDELRTRLASGTATDAARGLVRAAWAAGSTDNMTALVIELRP